MQIDEQKCKKNNSDTTSDTIFQVLDWNSYNECDSDGQNKFTIRLFGRTPDDKTIHVKVTDFKPYFYVEIPKRWNAGHIDIFVNLILSQIKSKKPKKKPSDNSDDSPNEEPETEENLLFKYEVVDSHKFDGFTNNGVFKFIRFIFNDIYVYKKFKSKETGKEIKYDASSFKTFERAFKKKIYHPQLAKKAIKYKLFESNIEPMLRCMHIRKIDACGWVKIPKDKVKTFDTKQSRCDIDINTSWVNLNRHESSSMSQFKIASFDIECKSEDGSFPKPERQNDIITQIATTFNRYGNMECYLKHIITLKSCDEKALRKNDPNIIVESYETEREVLLAWTRMISEYDPDIITGWNIFGFDYVYMYKRSQKLGISKAFCKLSRIIGEESPFKETKLASSALGDNFLKYLDQTGRVQIDMMKVAQRDHKLDSYKLDNVASHFIREKISNISKLSDKDENISVIHAKNTVGLQIGKYITITYNDGLSDNKFNEGLKYEILALTKNTITVAHAINIDELIAINYSIFWSEVKDDITPKEIFSLFNGNATDRAKLAKYCIQDCILCNTLMEKLQVLNNNIGMANVCSVPLSYLFLRGQGVKIFSLVSKKCREKNHIMPVIKKKYTNIDNEMEAKVEKHVNQLNNKHDDDDDDDDDDDEDNEQNDKYEGATVLIPKSGVYYQPVPVLDYSSLYPSSMIEKNLSHECLVKDDIYKNLPGYKYHTVTYNIIEDEENDKNAKTDNFVRKIKSKDKDNLVENVIKTKTCIFAQKINGEKCLVAGIIPEILQELLSARKRTKKLMESETDGFKKAVLDGLQAAYKITANSLYGQTGAPTSPIYCKDIAASTTAIGRERLMFAKTFIETQLGDIINASLTDKIKYIKLIKKMLEETSVDRFNNPREGFNNKDEFIEYIYDKFNTNLKGYYVEPEIIYGDTDSVFFCPRITDVQTKKQQSNKNALIMAILIGQMTSTLINMLLPYPQSLAYEKTMWPFVIITKKRYVGNLYETDPESYKQKSMGIVLKRRDNATIVKIVVGGIIKQILIHRSPKGAVEFTKRMLKKILAGKFDIDKFVITKTLKADYKDRTRIVHAILADRMGARDSGNKPMPNDRIPYAFIEVQREVELQGERVEHVNYILENKLKLDYLYYITNQIMKPAIQFLELIVENPKKIFNDYIVREENKLKGIKPINYYCLNKNIEVVKETVVENNIENMIDILSKSVDTNIKLDKIKSKSKGRKKKSHLLSENSNDNKINKINNENLFDGF